MEINQLSPVMKEAFENFKQFMGQEMQKDNEAVANASKDQDDPDANSDSTQSS